MSLAKDLEYTDELREVIVVPPADLWSDELPLESDLHRLQMQLLIDCLVWLWRSRNDFYASGNLTIYYSPQQIKSQDFRGPDFFVVLGTERKPRKSWVVWAENGQYPNVIVEIISPSTAEVDKGLKKNIYQNIFRTPEYFWFEPNGLELAGFLLVGGQYQTLETNPQGWLWSEQLELFLGVQNGQLRFFMKEGQLVPTPAEIAETLAAQLRDLGIEPNA
ncbi:MAG: Uma2 family endonuclease [Oscillatoriales cyanobacterium]|uniref:Uma2 family endonuclease n=1 Tax=Microcoleus anatoxicus PTRS2 TaxID=2705321 RepID=A0ABU8YQS4_9CYAN|nr:MAG: Uma2 family endonuclease [Oscillatoriales cyanobacterium]TAD93460.1 MAG: Uma2 family endonuclease [Oscillatoriales cyanobacterium]TAE04147.1 MAG: Uma2 family endonuclease [Oscillatoriales cyanobacterium]TAF36412.1 MAG: Uma2 family endonuclease [Oscillatoriales cyanobacterium]TAF62175.1 MAG: Uma2 family endonuclease [Oscillatoriales cyanobacterium]